MPKSFCASHRMRLSAWFAAAHSRCLNLVGGLLSWIARDRWKLADLDEHMVERYLRHRAGNRSIQQG